MVQKIDQEIKNNEFRTKDDKYYEITAILKDYKEKALKKIKTMNSKDIIDMYTRKNMLDTYVINSARKYIENKVK